MTIKPCPFCGSSATVWYRMDTTATVECNNEYCGCIYGDNMALKDKEAVKLWNRRSYNERSEEK